jgi:hypothetical protein
VSTRAAPVVALTVILLLSALPTTAEGTLAGAEIDPRLERQLGVGATTFWAILRLEADLGRAPVMLDGDARGQFVVDELKKVAHRSQQGSSTGTIPRCACGRTW